MASQQDIAKTPAKDLIIDDDPISAAAYVPQHEINEEINPAEHAQKSLYPTARLKFQC